MQSEIKKPSRSLVSPDSNESHSSGSVGPFGVPVNRLSRISSKRKYREIENSSDTHENGISKAISLGKASKPSVNQSPASKRLKKDHKDLRDIGGSSNPLRPPKTIRQLKYERLKLLLSPSDSQNDGKNIRGISDSSAVAGSITNANGARALGNQGTIKASVHLEDMVDDRLETSPKSMRQLYSTADSWSSDSSD